MLKLSAAALACAAACVAGPALADATLAPSQVAGVYSNAPDRTSPNGSYTGGFLTVNFSGNDFNYGLVQFDLTGQAPVSSATLTLSHVFNGANATFGLYEIVSAWDANTVTFNTRPSNAANPFATFSTSVFDFGGDDHAVDVTGMVNNWISGAHANNGFALIRQDAVNPFDYFQGSETPCCGGHGPRLGLVSVVNPPDPDPDPNPLPGPSGTPEPVTWALMLAGFGLTGAALRRSRQRAFA